MSIAIGSDEVTVDSVKKSKEDSRSMRKLTFVVGAAVLIFLAFTIFSVKNAAQSNNKLDSIQHLYFPVLERIDANIVRLDKMEERFLKAAMTGELDMVTEANEFYVQGEDTFVEISKLYPAQDIEISRLRKNFNNYKELATATSVAMINNQGKVPQQAIDEMNKSLADLKKEIKAFRQTSYDNFSSTLRETQRATQRGLYIGIATGIIDLIFMGVLVFFIKNTIKMKAIIAQQNATLELRVIERTAQLSQKTNDINAMLNNMKLGVCTVIPGNRLHQEYSAYMSNIFDTDDLAGKEVMQTLFSNSNLGEDIKEQIDCALDAILNEEPMMFDLNSHMLINEMEIIDQNGKRKLLQMDWNPIINETEIIDKMLLIVQDVTQLRELELATERQKKELNIISQIIKISVEKFNDFISSSNQFIEETRKLIQENDSYDIEVVAALFRNMHTIKGNARTYEFKYITDAAHAAEQEYDLLRNNNTMLWDSAKLLEKLDTVETAIHSYLEINEEKLGRKGRASDLLTTRGIFVSRDEIALLKSTVEYLHLREPNDTTLELRKTIHRLGLIRLERLASGILDSMSSLAKEIHKPTPTVRIINENLAFENTFAQTLKSSLMHIIRNALDHGIELPEERIRSNKPEHGQINFSCERHGEIMELHISDDGRGLALHKLYEKGVANGLFNIDEKPKPEAVAELVFQSGISTAEQLSQISGRGVGMDAVRVFLKEQGSDIRIILGHLDKNDQNYGFTSFKFAITLPPSSYAIV